MKIKLGKTSTSRTRAKKKVPVLESELLILKKQLHQKKQSYIDYLLSLGLSSKSIERYIFDLNRFEIWTEKENITLESVSYNDVLHYIQLKKKTITQSSISHILNSLKHYYNYLILIETISHNPTDQIQIKGIHRKKLHNILTPQELEQLFHQYQINENEKFANQNWYKISQFTFKRNKIILGLLIFQGLNVTELNNLKVEDVRLREGKIFISGTRKSNERELTLESVQMLDMMEYILKTRTAFQDYIQKHNDFLFTSAGVGNSLNNSMHKLLQQLKKINSKIINLNQIRTSVITHWLKRYNLRQTQYMAGHRYVSSTESYQINNIEELLDDITKFHPIG